MHIPLGIGSPAVNDSKVGAWSVKDDMKFWQEFKTLSSIEDYGVVRCPCRGLLCGHGGSVCLTFHRITDISVSDWDGACSGIALASLPVPQAPPAPTESESERTFTTAVIHWLEPVYVVLLWLYVTSLSLDLRWHLPFVAGISALICKVTKFRTVHKAASFG
jgi:hypothetical protein